MEVAIVVGISGFLSLAIMAMVTETTKSANQIKRQIELNNALEGFLYTLEQYMGQTVQVVSCACVASGTPCRNTADTATDAVGGTKFTFVYENATDPKSTPGSGCLLNGTTTIGAAASTIHPLGCKRLLELRFTEPTKTNGTTPSTPGKLELVWTQPSPPAAVGGTVLATLEGVTKFGCGMSINSGTSLSNSDLKLRIEVKSRVSNTNNVADAQYETWSPDGTDPKASTFNNGFRRAHLAQIFFRNLTSPGIQFGKIQQVKGCKDTGVAATSAAECCSGYRNPTTAQCVAVSSCVANTAGAAAPSAPGNSPDQCCSHMTDTTGTKCI